VLANFKQHAGTEAGVSQYPFGHGPNAAERDEARNVTMLGPAAQECEAWLIGRSKSTRLIANLGEDF
jgi:hypothetical protein